ncbi:MULTISPECIES: hypothetical protein [unclassified Acidovorax]|jgi:hypothetical protein|uniref:hypothetical protein n=1 Tax=unclassified Acidovorax TaxID=2684926 RepID=UPI001C4973BA|nr:MULTISPECIES: hypothetical protein [unclassified Acidovorax]MBV7460606.1 hypothetical protein [Acidovorax sp. sif0632]MBV7465631.1 hypothetical protein [Acidovorax sp. sif0613]
MNPATRILAVLESFLPLAHGNPQVDGWNTWLEGTGTAARDENVMRALQAIRKEVRLLERKMIELQVPEPLYAGAIKGLTDTFRTAFLHVQWGKVHAKVTAAEVRASLAWMSWVLGKFDENEVDTKVMATLVQALQDQETLLQGANLPAGLRELLEGQVEELRIALMLYRLNGVQPIVDAVNKQSGEMRNAPEELVAEVAKAGPEARSAVANGMDLISKAAKVAESGSKIVKFGKEIYELSVSGYTMLGQAIASSSTPLP